jgi:hypothetical protein
MTTQTEDKRSMTSNADKKEPTAGTRGLVKKQYNKSNKNILMDDSSEINNELKLPILRGFRVRGLVFVHCPWCDRMLVHGWGRADSARVIEVRCAHGGHQPPAPSGYRISVFRQKDLKIVDYPPVKKKGGATHVK